MAETSAAERVVVPARRGMSRQQRRTLTFYLFISPWLIGFTALSIIPLILGFLTSLTNYDGLNLSSIKFTGILPDVITASNLGTQFQGGGYFVADQVQDDDSGKGENDEADADGDSLARNEIVEYRGKRAGAGCLSRGDL